MGFLLSRMGWPWFRSSPPSRDIEMGRIEDYRRGYPRYTALLSKNPSWFISRRFDKLRARLLLLKQDRLAILEERLERIDREEEELLFLGANRDDTNTDRLSTLSDIETSLADYDQFLQRTSKALSAQPANMKDVKSLQNWVNDNCCLALEETAYLSHRDELISLVPVTDSAVTQIESWVEDKLIRYMHCPQRSRFHDYSADEDIYIYRGPLIQRTARTLLIFLITLLLMSPVVICNLISTISARIVVIMLFTILYLLILSCLTKSRTMELILAGATYATVLIVFVSGTSTL
ncbi:hypothetical protein F4677DRAFT_398262 [Hypoxylon crocopeplum]|nr:hypothetical protein F4677DRAFT_398262 [Hypoxylon crocopeplum]